MKKRAKLLLSMFAGSGLLLASISGAQAAFVLTLDDTALGGVQVVVADNTGAGVAVGGGLVTTAADSDGTAGIVAFSGVAGTFLTNVSTGISKPVLGPPSEISLSSVNISGGIGGNMIVGLSDTDFTGSPTATQLGIGGVAAGTVSVVGQIDGGNALFGGAAGSAGALGPFGPGAFSGDIDTAVAVAGPYSLSLLVTIDSPAFSTHLTSFGANLKAVPVPGALLLFGSAFIGLVGVGRLKLGKNSE